MPNDPKTEVEVRTWWTAGVWNGEKYFDESLELKNRDWRYKMAMPFATTDSHGGDMAEWPEDLKVREFPKP